MWDKIQEFISDSSEEIRDDGWGSYLISFDRPVRTIIFGIIVLFFIGTIIKGIIDGSLFLFLGMAILILWVFSKVVPYR